MRPHAPTVLLWYILAIAIFSSLVAALGCGSVTETRAPSDAAAGDTSTDLDAPASDTHQPTENPPSDAGTVEGGAPPVCSGDTVIVVSRCSSTCAICHWASWALPAPSGCRAQSGDLCASDCSSCP